MTRAEGLAPTAVVDTLAATLVDASGARAVLVRGLGAVDGSFPRWPAPGDTLDDAPSSCPQSCARFIIIHEGAASAVFGFGDDVEPPSEQRLGALLRLAARAAAASDVEARTRLITIGEIVSGISHDIGTPLNVISGYAESILMTTPDGAPVRKQVSSILEQTRRIAAMVRQMLDIVRPSPEHAEGSQPLERFAADVHQISGHMLRRREVRCRLEDAGEAGAVSGDLPRLHQALFGLLRGAARIVGPRGQLALRATAGPAFVLQASNGDRSSVDLAPLASDGERFDDDDVNDDMLVVRRVLAERGGGIELDDGNGAPSGAVRVRLGEAGRR